MTQQNPGIHHVAVGDITVTALNDGVFQGSTDMLVHVEQGEAETMLRKTYRAVPPMLTVNAFLIRHGDHLALVDAGAGNQMGPTVGHLKHHLETLGIAASEITTVLMTHLHGDHIGGLTDDQGQALFPNAELVISETEASFWNDPAVEAAAPDAMKKAIANVKRLTAPYAARTRRVTEGEVLPGIHLKPLPGHTPGHAGFLVESGNQSMLIWGDIVHLPGLQFADPGIGMAFDVDGAQAIATRRQVMEMAASDGVRIAGMHLDFPTFAHLVRDGAGYTVVPEVWMPS